MRSLRSLFATALVGGLLVSGSAVVATTAQAAPVRTVAVSAAKTTPTKVTIKKIATKTAPYAGKTTIKPRVMASGKVSVKSKTLTVKHGKKTVAKNKKSVKLAAGTYKVTTKATYKTYKVKTTTKTVTKKKVGVAFGTDVTVTCTASKVDLDGGYGDLVATCTSSRFDGARKESMMFLDMGDGTYYGFGDNLDELTTRVVPQVGKPFSATLNAGDDLKKSYQAKQTTTTKVWSKTKSRSLTQKLVIKKGKRPNHTAPISEWNCPSWAPIKGNADSGIYHVPGGRWYSRTKPEICFTTRGAAEAAGYRASKNG
ncbi:hypothetical protein GCM10025864_28930 [Luteimicrobium album]|uniref:Uncharacterized protein n=1 Tax=Luteimicrobium album TaxID=1054550 RepID=A0ABQ6I2Z4_9MICO|nr:hypothetical protein [Luteimicrobium album]GMA25134.1 hypothetical protein GCM10025864_28930 [Luteimicrobium album]